MVITTRYGFTILRILLVGLLSPNLINAQSSLGYQWYINANVGLVQLYGDVHTEDNPISKLKAETDLGYGARMGKYISPVFSGYFQFMKGKFQGQNNNDLKFSTDAIESYLGVTVNLTNLIFGKKERTFNFYGLAGTGAIFFRSEARWISNGELVNDYGYSNDDGQNKATREIALVFPVGLGVDVKLADKWYLNLETALRLTNSDKLDAIVRGGHNDAYYYTSLGLSYNFGMRKKIGPEVKPEELAEEPKSPYASSKVDLEYDFPNHLRSFDQFVLKSTIHKGNIDGPADLTQILPIGFLVLDSVIDGARVEFKNYTLYLYWDELPADSVFEISYNVQLSNIYGNLPMTSILYLDRTGKYYKFKTNVFIERKSDSELVVSESDHEKQQKEASEMKKVEFRIQVRAAYKTEIPLQQLANRYHLSDEIKVDYLDNWYRYSIGSFESFKKAKEYRNAIIKEHGVQDAFIVAFYDGKRLNDIHDLKDIAPEAYPFARKNDPKAQTEEKEQTEQKEQPEQKKQTGTCYRVQILATMKKGVDPVMLKNKYNIEEAVNEEVYHNWNKYTVGDCLSKEDALELRKKLIDKGIVDAFVVIFKNGERATYGEHK
ncbi:MAG: outer membrane beta-barrel protein [Bacteroidales bacterium]|nr:outer membrane beta-barrel protein [Bacteroidales bacterium]